MREGSNIHYSSDNKLLCSFSAKLCRQRRLNGYGFCVRHILEDPSAPFRQCSHVNKNNKQQCTNAIPQNELREYCNNHLIMLGLIPRKEKKTKAPSAGPVSQTPPSSSPLTSPAIEVGCPMQRPALPEDLSRLVASFDAGKPQVHTNGVKVQNLNKLMTKPVKKTDLDKPRLRLELAKPDSEDPYAFQDEPNSPTVGTVSPFMSPSPAPSPARPSWSPSPQRPQFSPSSKTMPSPGRPAPSPGRPAPSPGRPSWSPSSQRPPSRSPLPTPERGLSAARLYPELAEKLYSKPIKPQEALKTLAVKTALKSSRTMNALETKIAQNKIKDKIKRQEHGFTGPDTEPSSPKQAFSPQAKNGLYPLDSHYLGNGPLHVGLSAHTLMAAGRSPPPQPFERSPPVQAPVMSRSPPSKPVTRSPSTAASGRSPPATAAASVHNTGLTHPSGAPHMILGGRAHAAGAPNLVRVNHGTPHSTTPAFPTRIGVPHSTGLPASTGQRMPQTSTPTGTQSALPQTFPTTRAPPPYSLKPVKANKPGTDRPVSERIERLLQGRDMTERQARRKFRDRRAVNMYKQYSRRKLFSRDLSAAGIDSSDSSDESSDLLPWQRVWFSPSSEDEEPSDDSEDDLAIQRTTRHALMKTRLRRHFLQMHRNHRADQDALDDRLSAAQAMIETAKREPDLALRVLNAANKEESKPRCLLKEPVTRACLANKGGACDRPALPFTHHCRKHIMYNVDQQLFDYCTGKNDDNTQCCDPVFNVKYDFPLCAKHALIAIRQAAEVSQTKKRKKTKPSALTRPPKRGRKKRALQRTKALRPSSPDDSQDDNDTVNEGGVEGMDVQEDTGNDLPAQPPTSPVPLNPVEKIAKDLAKIDRQLSTGARPFGHEPLPYSVPDLTPNYLGDASVNLEQAARLLEEHDINEVLNKLPDEAFDIFSGKNGDYVPSHEETEELERALAAVSETVDRTKHTLDQMGFMDEHEDDDDLITKQIADQILHQNMVTDQLNGEDHLQDLANSISDHDLKTMSQAFSAYDLESRLERGTDLFGLNGTRDNAGTSQPVEWTSASGPNGYQNGSSHVPQKLTQDLVALLASQLMPQNRPNGEQGLVYQLALSLPVQQNHAKQGT